MCSATVAGSAHDDGCKQSCSVGQWRDATSKSKIFLHARRSDENFASNPHLIFNGGLVDTFFGSCGQHLLPSTHASSQEICSSVDVDDVNVDSHYRCYYLDPEALSICPHAHDDLLDVPFVSICSFRFFDDRSQINWLAADAGSPASGWRTTTLTFEGTAHNLSLIYYVIEVIYISIPFYREELRFLSNRLDLRAQTSSAIKPTHDQVPRGVSALLRNICAQVGKSPLSSGV